VTVTAVELDDDNNFVRADLTTTFYLYDSLRLYFDNGGGDCYIVSVGNYKLPADGNLLKAGVEAVKSYDEPTILLFPDAAGLAANGLKDVQTTALSQCGALGDRVAVLDTRKDDPLGTEFRTNIGINNLKYGAAYTPWLNVILPKNVRYTDVKDVITKNGVAVTLKSLTSDTQLKALIQKVEDGYSTAASDLSSAKAALTTKKSEQDTAENALKTARAAAAADPGNAALKTAETDAQGAAVAAKKATATAQSAFDAGQLKAKNLESPANDFELELLQSFGLYANLIRGIGNTMTTCPPSGAIAGVYAFVDGQRGVWKAPANVSLNGVVGPIRTFDLKETDDLNVDADAGKSINAIRAFAGRGTLVWGARTLAGNDNEWRYISVRRFFNMVEESVKKSTYWAVFEPNDANTWVKIRGMIENYLTQKWREGALAGATTKEAFFVRCALGVTMNSQDILEGRVYVEIGMAVVRPVEFIIMRFSHKLQTS
jgi:phage tail sheath protein FI